MWQWDKGRVCVCVGGGGWRVVQAQGVGGLWGGGGGCLWPGARHAVVLLPRRTAAGLAAVALPAAPAAANGGRRARGRLRPWQRGRRGDPHRREHAAHIVQGPLEAAQALGARRSVAAL